MAVSSRHDGYRLGNDATAPEREQCRITHRTSHCRPRGKASGICWGGGGWHHPTPFQLGRMDPQPTAKAKPFWGRGPVTMAMNGRHRRHGGQPLPDEDEPDDLVGFYSDRWLDRPPSSAPLPARPWQGWTTPLPPGRAVSEWDRPGRAHTHTGC